MGERKNQHHPSLGTPEKSHSICSLCRGLAGCFARGSKGLLHSSGEGSKIFSWRGEQQSMPLIHPQRGLEIQTVRSHPVPASQSPFLLAWRSHYSDCLLFRPSVQSLLNSHSIPSFMPQLFRAGRRAQRQRGKAPALGSLVVDGIDKPVKRGDLVVLLFLLLASHSSFSCRSSSKRNPQSVRLQEILSLTEFPCPRISENPPMFHQLIWLSFITPVCPTGPSEGTPSPGIPVLLSFLFCIQPCLTRV